MTGGPPRPQRGQIPQRPGRPLRPARPGGPTPRPTLSPQSSGPSPQPRTPGPTGPSPGPGPRSGLQMTRPRQAGVAPGGAGQGPQLRQPPAAQFQQRLQTPGRGRSNVRATLEGGTPGSESGSTARSDVAVAAQGMQDLNVSQVGSVASSTGARDLNGNGEKGDGGIGRGATRGKSERASTKILRTRPKNVNTKQGDVGHKIDLLTNSFPIRQKPDWTLLQYRVDTKPIVDDTRLRSFLIKQCKGKLGPFVNSGEVIYSVHKFQADPTSVWVESRDGTKYEVIFRFTNELDSSDYGYNMVCNIIMRDCLQALNLTLVGRNFYDSKDEKHIPNFHLKLWPGYITSIRQHEYNLLMCCEISHKVMRTDTVMDQLKEIARSTGAGDFPTNAKKILLGTIVMTKYNNKTYRVDDIDFNSNPRSTFFHQKQNKDISYVEYYKTQYQIDVKDGGQPLLISVPRDRNRKQEGQGDQLVKLVPELCHLTGLSEKQRADFRLMKELAEYTRMGPSKRVESLRGFSKRLKETPQVRETLMQWNMKMDEELVRISNARRLDPEKIVFKGDKTLIYGSDNADWGSCFRNNGMFKSCTISSWCCIYPKMLEAQVRNFVGILHKSFASLACDVKQPVPAPIPDQSPRSYTSELEKQLKGNSREMVMVVIPDNRRADLYSSIKRLTYVNYSIPSQVMTGTVLKKDKGIQSVATKVAIQMCAKMGGVPWALSMPKDNKFMVVGFDSYHDTVDKNISVGALVATFDDKCTKYVSYVTLHKDFSELMPKMKDAMRKAFQLFREKNRCDPSKVFFFRDGVGDGQIPEVKKVEVENLKSLMADRNMTNTTLTYIIVSKRLNTKFFTETRGKIDNPTSGTVIDDIVTLPERYDFFLVSQSVRQGTVNPTGYNIIEDNSGLKPGHLQLLSYKLAHLYFNWSGTVRVPAPCQYAHKLAFLVGNSIHKNPNEKLSDVLYYL